MGVYFWLAKNERYLSNFNQSILLIFYVIYQIFRNYLNFRYSLGKLLLARN